MKKIGLVISILLAVVLGGCGRNMEPFGSNEAEIHEEIAEETSLEMELVSNDEPIQEGENAVVDYRSIYYDFLLDTSEEYRAEREYQKLNEYSLLNVQDSAVPYLLIAKQVYAGNCTIELYTINNESNVEMVFSAETSVSIGCKIMFSDDGSLYVLTSYGLNYFTVEASEYCIKTDSLREEKEQIEQDFIYSEVISGWNKERQHYDIEYYYLINSEEVTPKEFYRLLYNESKEYVHVIKYDMTEENIEMLKDESTVFSEKYDMIGEYFHMFDQSDSMEKYYNDSALLDIDDVLQEYENAVVDYRTIYYDFLSSIDITNQPQEDLYSQEDLYLMEYSLLSVNDSDVPYLIIVKDIFINRRIIELFKINNELNVEKVFSTDIFDAYTLDIMCDEDSTLYALAFYGTRGGDHSVVSEYCIKEKFLGVENKKSECDYEFCIGIGFDAESELPMAMQDFTYNNIYKINSEEVSSKELYGLMYDIAQSCFHLKTYEITEENVELIKDDNTVFSDDIDKFKDLFALDYTGAFEIYYNDSALLDIVLTPDEMEIGVNDSGDLVNWDLNLYFSDRFKDLDSLDSIIMSWDDEPNYINLSGNEYMFDDFGWSAALQGKTRYMVSSVSNTGEYNLSIGLPDEPSIAGEQYIIIGNTKIKLTLAYLGDYHSGLGWKMSDVVIADGADIGIRYTADGFDINVINVECNEGYNVDFGLNDKGHPVNWSLYIQIEEDYYNVKNVVCSWDNDAFQINDISNIMDASDFSKYPEYLYPDDYGWAYVMEGKTVWESYNNNAMDMFVSVKLPNRPEISGRQYVILNETKIEFTLSSLGDYHTGLGWKISDVSVSHAEAEDYVVNPETEDDSVYTETVAETDYRSTYTAYLKSLISDGETKDTRFAVVDSAYYDKPFLVIETPSPNSVYGIKYYDFYTIENDNVVGIFGIEGNCGLMFSDNNEVVYSALKSFGGDGGLYYRIDGYSNLYKEDLTRSQEYYFSDFTGVSRYKENQEYYESMKYSVNGEYVSDAEFYGDMNKALDGYIEVVFYDLKEENVKFIYNDKSCFRGKIDTFFEFLKDLDEDSFAKYYTAQ